VDICNYRGLKKIMFNYELQEMYNLPNIFKIIKLWNTEQMEDILCMGCEEKEYKRLSDRREEKKFLARSRCRWKNNIELNLQEIGWVNVL
jgi:hypothetical protein